MNKCAGDLVTASVHSQVLAALPSGLVNDEQITYGRSVESILKILHSDVCVLGGVSLHREVEAARGLIQKLGEGVCPEDRTLSSYSAFMKSVIKKAENFSLFSKADGEHIFGRAAIEYKLAEYGRLCHTFDLKQQMGKLRELRRFEFLLDVTQRTRVGEWLQASLSSAVEPVDKPGADESTYKVATPLRTPRLLCPP